MKYAILESGGKQYLALEGQAIEVDRLPVEVGKPVELKDVLLVGDDGQVAVGTPVVEGARVKATVAGHELAPKVIVFKYIPKERYRRKRGHRQQYTRLAIESILLPAEVSRRAVGAEAAGGPPPKKAKPAAARRKPAAKAGKKPAAPKPAAKARPKAVSERKPAKKKAK